MRFFMFFIERIAEERRKLNYDSSNCVGCGICTEICPTSSLRLGPIVPIARGLIDMDLVSINEDSCVFCGLCATGCPFNSLSLYVDGENIKSIDSYPSWDIQSTVSDDDCIYCGRCYSVCPTDSILFERNLPDSVDLVRGEIEIDKNQCIYCSFCADMCPAGAIAIKNVPTASNDLLNNTIEVDFSKCIFCGICKRICPENAIKQICSTCMLIDEIEVPSIKGTTVISDESCVYCSWCSEVCPVDAITITKPFEGCLELVEIENKDKICKGDSCHACRDVCPCNAVEIVDNKATINLDFCNLCGVCVTACPQNIRVLSRSSMNLININSNSWDEILKSVLIEK